MIDIVFLLLIFFLTTASFSNPEHLTKAAITSQTNTGSAANDLDSVAISLTDQNGETQFQIGGVMTSDLLEVINRLKSLTPRPKTVYVEVNDKVAFRDPVKMIAACQNANFSNVVYLPQP